MTDILDTSTITLTDATNNSGTLPTWAEGMAPSQVNDSARALQGAIARWAHHANFTISTTGSANAYILTYGASQAQYRQGDVYCFIASFANTGSASLNVNGLGAKTLKRTIDGGATALVGGELKIGTRVIVQYHSSDDAFYIVNMPDVLRTNTFTPGLRFGGGSTGMTTSSASGKYIVIDGSFVAFTLRITLSAKGTSTGAATIISLPFSADGAPIWGGGASFYQGMSSVSGGISYYMGGTSLTLVTPGASGTTGLTEANFTNTSDIIISGIYKVA